MLSFATDSPACFNDKAPGLRQLEDRALSEVYLNDVRKRLSPGRMLPRMTEQFHHPESS